MAELPSVFAPLPSLPVDVQRRILTDNALDQLTSYVERRVRVSSYNTPEFPPTHSKESVSRAITTFAPNLWHKMAETGAILAGSAPLAAYTTIFPRDLTDELVGDLDIFVDVTAIIPHNPSTLTFVQVLLEWLLAPPRVIRASDVMGAAAGLNSTFDPANVDPLVRDLCPFRPPPHGFHPLERWLWELKCQTFEVELGPDVQYRHIHGFYNLPHSQNSWKPDQCSCLEGSSSSSSCSFPSLCPWHERNATCDIRPTKFSTPSSSTLMCTTYILGSLKLQIIQLDPQPWLQLHPPPFGNHLSSLVRWVRQQFDIACCADIIFDGAQFFIRNDELLWNQVTYLQHHACACPPDLTQVEYDCLCTTPSDQLEPGVRLALQLYKHALCGPTSGVELHGNNLGMEDNVADVLQRRPSLYRLVKYLKRGWRFRISHNMSEYALVALKK